MIHINIKTILENIPKYDRIPLFIMIFGAIILLIGSIIIGSRGDILIAVWFSLFFILLVIIIIVKSIKKTKRLRNKFEQILDAIENYSTDRIIRDEREFESVLYEYLKYKFPNYKVKPQHKINKGRVDIIIDNEIALELKIADNSGNLNSLFGQIEWYKDEFKNLGIIILDIDNVSNIDDFRRRFKLKGVRVIVLNKKQVRFKR